MSLHIYFDGAGDVDKPVMTVGGFMADSAVCEVIEQEWEKATEGKVFHLKDYGTNKCKLGSKNWDKSKHEKFLKKLARIVNRPGSYIMSASIEVALFNESLKKANHPQEIGPAFSGCAFVAVLNVETVLLNQGMEQQRVTYVFEKGDREHEISITFADWAESNSRLCGLRSHRFQPKATILLQPADLIAGSVQRCLITARNTLPMLDNGLHRVQLNTFERYYSSDGVTAAVVSGHDKNHCWIVNPKSFDFIDGISRRFFEVHPHQLKKRRKLATFKPKANL